MKRIVMILIILLLAVLATAQDIPLYEIKPSIKPSAQQLKLFYVEKDTANKDTIANYKNKDLGIYIQQKEFDVVSYSNDQLSKMIADLVQNYLKGIGRTDILALLTDPNRYKVIDTQQPVEKVKKKK